MRVKRGPRKPKGVKREVRPEDIEPIYPWERQPDESKQAFSAFEHYLNMEDLKRTVREAGREMGRVYSQVSAWTARHDWVRRAKAYDMDQNRKRRVILDKAIHKMHERQANHAVLGQMAALNTLQNYVKTEENPEPPKLKERDAIRLFDVASRIERLARGEPDTITETKGKLEITPGVGPDDTRRSMIKLLEDPQAVAHMAAISKILGTDGSDDKA